MQRATLMLNKNKNNLQQQELLVEASESFEKRRSNTYQSKASKGNLLIQPLDLSINN